MSVVIVVPAFAEGEKGDKPVVVGQVAREESGHSPGMSGGVDQPSRVQPDYGPHEKSPHQEWKAADGEKQNAGKDHGNVVVFRNPDMKFRFCKIGHIAG